MSLFDSALDRVGRLIAHRLERPLSGYEPYTRSDPNLIGDQLSHAIDMVSCRALRRTRSRCRRRRRTVCMLVEANLGEGIDRGYSKSEELAACEEAGIETYIPKPLTSNARAEGRFDRRDFVYDRESNAYVCPTGERLTYRMTTKEAGKVPHRYWTNACGACALKVHFTSGKERRVTRWEHEDVLERAQERLDGRPDAMAVRRSTVEHPFATIKARMGATHFRMKTLKHVATEMALHVLAYNMKRVMTILGVPGLLRAI